MRYIFATVFFISTFVSLFWGLKIARLNIKSSINRTFLFVCIALSIWSFGFAMANLSQKLSSVLLCRRLSAVGWTTILSLILHYLLLVTSEKSNARFDKRLLLLHIPAIINSYIFAFSNNMALVQYNLVKIDYGWTNVAANNGWDFFYYLYYPYVYYKILYWEDWIKLL